MKYLVSIMIPAYNQPQYIVEAVESALAQDYPNLEVIVSDDSTNLETQQALKPFLADKRFIYHKTTERLGRVANYRKLLYELSMGEWVLMLDGDDYYTDNNYVSRAMHLIEENSHVVLVGAGIRVADEQAGESREQRLVDADIIFEGTDIITKKLNLPNHQTDLYAAPLARTLDFYRSPSTGSDSESLFRLCLRGDVAYLADIVAVWRVHGQNATYNHDINRQLRELNFIDSVYEDAIAIVPKKPAKQWRNNLYRGMTIHLLGMAFAAKNDAAVIKILFHNGRYLGVKLTLQYMRRLWRSVWTSPRPSPQAEREVEG